MRGKKWGLAQLERRLAARRVGARRKALFSMRLVSTSGWWRFIVECDEKVT
jgi:hypothetical protein